MLLGALGNTMKAVYFDSPVTSISATATVGRDVKTLTVDVAVMRTQPNGYPCVWGNNVNEDMKILKERFIQANVNVTVNPAVEFDPPLSAQNTNWLAGIHNNILGYETSFATKQIIDASGLGTNNLRIIYVPEVRVNTNFVTIVAAGLAISTHGFLNSLDQLFYVDTCFISSRLPLGDDTPAHEIVHLFLGAGHSPEMWNLMYPIQTPWDDLRGTRRLTQEQVDGIRADGILRGKLK